MTPFPQHDRSAMMYGVHDEDVDDGSARDRAAGNPRPGSRRGAADGVEHLQRAAREMIAAARSFLDAAERVVEDNEALRDLSDTFGEVAMTVVESVRGAARPAPWVDPAMGGSGPSSTGDDVDGPDGRATVRAQSDRAAPGPPASDRVETVQVETDRDDDTEDWARPLVDAETPRRPSRVRRIAVD